MQILGICVAWVVSTTNIIVCPLEIVKWNKTISVKWFAATLSHRFKVHCMICYLSLTVIVAAPYHRASHNFLSLSVCLSLSLSQLCKQLRNIVCHPLLQDILWWCSQLTQHGYRWHAAGVLWEFSFSALFPWRRNYRPIFSLAGKTPLGPSMEACCYFCNWCWHWREGNALTAEATAFPHPCFQISSFSWEYIKALSVLVTEYTLTVQNSRIVVTWCMYTSKHFIYRNPCH